MGIEYFTKSVSLDSEVWEALGRNPLSANQLLRVQLGLDKSAVPSKRRLSRLDREVQARAASDVSAPEAGREDIDYSDTESLPMTHILHVGRGIRPKGDKSR